MQYSAMKYSFLIFILIMMIHMILINFPTTRAFRKVTSNCSSYRMAYGGSVMALVQANTEGQLATSSCGTRYVLCLLNHFLHLAAIKNVRCGV